MTVTFSQLQDLYMKVRPPRSLGDVEEVAILGGPKTFPSNRPDDPCLETFFLYAVDTPRGIRWQARGITVTF